MCVPSLPTNERTLGRPVGTGSDDKAFSALSASGPEIRTIDTPALPCAVANAKMVSMTYSNTPRCSSSRRIRHLFWSVSTLTSGIRSHPWFPSDLEYQSLGRLVYPQSCDPERFQSYQCP